MRSGRRAALVLGMAVACAAGYGVTAATVSAAPEPAALAACANPALPPAILAGVFAGSAPPLPTIQAGGASVPLVLAVAADEGSRELGLMCVTRLRPHAGMIFVFSAPAVQEFWMKNTLVPLDMVWVAPDGRVTSVAAHVPASTRETPDDAVARRRGQGLYVIELADGEAASDGIVAGVKLLLPKLRSRE
jgi:uncharacterized membrane protein (UPF0127 family)